MSLGTFPLIYKGAATRRTNTKPLIVSPIVLSPPFNITDGYEAREMVREYDVRECLNKTFADSILFAFFLLYFYFANVQDSFCFQLYKGASTAFVDAKFALKVEYVISTD